MMRTLIDIVRLEGTLVVICDIVWTLLFAGNLIMESFIIDYLWQFIHDPIRYGNQDKLIFLKQGNKDLPCFNSAWQRVGISHYSVFTEQSVIASPYSVSAKQSVRTSPYSDFVEPGDRTSLYTVSTGQTVRDSPWNPALLICGQTH